MNSVIYIPILPSTKSLTKNCDTFSQIADSALRKVLMRFVGGIQSLRIMSDKFSGVCKGYGFVQVSPKDAER